MCIKNIKNFLMGAFFYRNKKKKTKINNQNKGYKEDILPPYLIFSEN